MLHFDQFLMAVEASWTAKVRPTGDGRRLFELRREGEVLLDLEYAYRRPWPSLGRDPTPFRDQASTDFLLHVARLINEETELERLGKLWTTGIRV
jgi:hypothetical protein